MGNVTPLKYDTLFTIRVDEEFLKAVEELRRLQDDPIPSKSKLIRDLVTEALKRARARRGR